uniref:uncharacterized protein LOC105351291 n=1 Tax=Fragaria vesca subsp. vesca TaxID=101020 RepID=UPI0005CB4314|nr:PREDICTED: uncharacterized protein LOC105351291 [Fragaria vesca subsp. vesca]
MTDVPIRNLNLDFPAKRRVDEVAVDDEIRSPKQSKRQREEFDEHTAGNGNSTSQDKEPPMVDDGSSLVLQQNENKGSNAKKDSGVKEVIAPKEEEGYDSPVEDFNVVIYKGEGYGYLC